MSATLGTDVEPNQDSRAFFADPALDTESFAMYALSWFWLLAESRLVLRCDEGKGLDDVVVRTKEGRGSEDVVNIGRGEKLTVFGMARRIRAPDMTCRARKLGRRAVGEAGFGFGMSTMPSSSSMSSMSESSISPSISSKLSKSSMSEDEEDGDGESSLGGGW